MTVTSTPSSIPTTYSVPSVPSVDTFDSVVSPARPTLWRTGLVSGLAASAATTVVAVAAQAIDVPLEADSEAFPLAGFAQLTLFFTVVGVLIARVISTRARHPRSMWVKTTVALTALSFVPDLMISTDTATKVTLMLTHVVAAAIVIPAIASRLPEEQVR